MQYEVIDCNALQEDLYKANEFFKTNQLKLNINQTKLISFQKKNDIQFNYSLNEQNMEKVSIMKDLGILLDEKLMFKFHIDYR